MNSQGLAYPGGTSHCLRDPAHGPSTWTDRFLRPPVGGRLAGFAVGWDWRSSRDQGRAAATSLRLLVPGKGQEVVCGER